MAIDQIQNENKKPAQCGKWKKQDCVWCKVPIITWCECTQIDLFALNK